MKLITIAFSMSLLVLSGSSIAQAQEFQWQAYHLKNGVKCQNCHGADTQAAVKNSSCLACHGSYNELAQKTKDMQQNPHMSPHFENLECSSCHSSHTQLTNFCQNCHGPIVRDAKFSKIK